MPVSVTPLTPLRFLERSAEVFPDKPAIVDGARRLTYRDFAREATRTARALQASGIEPGDRVDLCMNSIELLVAHFAVPLAGGVLVTINTRLAAEEVADICDHSGAYLSWATRSCAPRSTRSRTGSRRCARSSPWPARGRAARVRAGLRRPGRARLGRAAAVGDGG